jgi:membrane protease YdiL (CAAX protease family)
VLSGTPWKGGVRHDLLMKDRIRALSGRVEFLVVIFGAFGLFLPSNVAMLFGPQARSAHPAHAVASDAEIVGLVIYEAIVLLVLGSFLRTRSWTLERIGLKPTLRATLQGLALVLLVYLINLAVWVLASSVWPDAAEAARMVERLFEGSRSLGPVLAVSIVNPVFEEVFVCAYIVTALKERRGVAFAVNVSTAVRVTYHLYQGAAGVISVVPVGLLFAYYYARNGKLWPLIVAHGVLDFMALMYN